MILAIVIKELELARQIVPKLKLLKKLKMFINKAKRANLSVQQIKPRLHLVKVQIRLSSPQNHKRWCA